MLNNPSIKLLSISAVICLFSVACEGKKNETKNQTKEEIFHSQNLNEIDKLFAGVINSKKDAGSFKQSLDKMGNAFNKYQDKVLGTKTNNFEDEYEDFSMELSLAKSKLVIHNISEIIGFSDQDENKILNPKSCNDIFIGLNNLKKDIFKSTQNNLHNLSLAIKNDGKNLSDGSKEAVRYSQDVGGQFITVAGSANDFETATYSKTYGKDVNNPNVIMDIALANIKQVSKNDASSYKWTSKLAYKHTKNNEYVYIKENFILGVDKGDLKTIDYKYQDNNYDNELGKNSGIWDVNVKFNSKDKTSIKISYSHDYEKGVKENKVNFDKTYEVIRRPNGCSFKIDKQFI